MDPGALSAATLSMGQTVVAYQWLMPPIQTVRESVPDATLRANVLMGQAAAGLLSLTVGIMLSWLTGSAIPVWTAITMALVIGATYQYAMTRGAME